ncbi:type II toxin-antitoxin system HicB family antitoxin [bacterium]|nr:MAG: type II toxin-antitoxin system HicB family antitoxin [bacterium]
MKHYQFSIIVEKDKNGYFVSCPELQGCYSQGITYEEALENIKDAIKLHLADRIVAKEKVSDTESLSLGTIKIAV